MADSAAVKIVKLNGKNFQSWKFNMKCLLMERGIWRYVDNDNPITKPEVKVNGIQVFMYFRTLCPFTSVNDPFCQVM